MKHEFIIDRNFLVRTRENIKLDPKDFLSCATIEELNNEVLDYINNNIEHPSHPDLSESECLGTEHSCWDDSGDFYVEWQKLKGLPQEL